MKFSDLLSMSVNNLRRRKLRTFLTVLGVLIGTASIVVMVSLGIGFNELTMEQIASYGSLTEVSVYSNAMWGGNESSKDPNYMTDDVIAQFERIDHVNTASPLLETSVLMTQGAYQAYINLIGVTQEYMKNIPLKEGQIPEAGKRDLQMIVGNMVARNFSNPKSNRNNYYDDPSSIPDIDFINRPMFVIFDMDAYYQSQNGGTGEGGATVKPPKKYLIPTAGLVEGGPEDWNNYSYSVYVDLDALKAQLKQIFKKKPIPNQPTNKKGKPYNYFIYQQAVVEVDDMNNVTAVQKAITDMAFRPTATWSGWSSLRSRPRWFRLFWRNRSSIPVCSGNWYRQYHDDVHLRKNKGNRNLKGPWLRYEQYQEHVPAGVRLYRIFRRHNGNPVQLWGFIPY